MSRLQQKIAVITGGNSGIGLATAKAWSAEGAKVIITGRNEETLASAASEIGEGTITVVGDLREAQTRDKLVDAVREIGGQVHAVFANAGVAMPSPFEAADEAHFDTIFDINVKALYFTTQALSPFFVDGTSVIFNTTALVEKGLPGMSVYSASKAAVRSLARTLAAEFAAKGVRVNCIAPGPIETPIYGRMGLPVEAAEEMGQQIQSMVPINRFGQADEIARVALFLASTDSSYMTGSEVTVDGGFAQV
jgi:NAD(P)-dependent dehydrogenase (short-subunit alcohol dehydrogenase family)